MRLDKTDTTWIWGSRPVRNVRYDPVDMLPNRSSRAKSKCLQLCGKPQTVQRDFETASTPRPTSRLTRWVAPLLIQCDFRSGTDSRGSLREPTPHFLKATRIFASSSEVLSHKEALVREANHDYKVPQPIGESAGIRNKSSVQRRTSIRCPALVDEFDFDNFASSRSGAEINDYAFSGVPAVAKGVANMFQCPLARFDPNPKPDWTNRSGPFCTVQPR